MGVGGPGGGWPRGPAAGCRPVCLLPLWPPPPLLCCFLIQASGLGFLGEQVWSRPGRGLQGHLTSDADPFPKREGNTFSAPDIWPQAPHTQLSIRPPHRTPAPSQATATSALAAQEGSPWSPLPLLFLDPSTRPPTCGSDQPAAVGPSRSPGPLLTKGSPPWSPFFTVPAQKDCLRPCLVHRDTWMFITASFGTAEQWTQPVRPSSLLFTH